MAVRMRLTRVGSKKNPIYRVVVADSRSPRDGRFIEIVGRYNPQTDPSTIELDADKVKDWLAKGAQPSDPVARLIKAAGIGEAVTALSQRLRQQPPSGILTRAGSASADRGRCGARMAELLAWIARRLVDEPDAVRVETEELDDATVLRLHVAPDDVGKVIGRQGRIARALRTLVRASGTRDGRRVVLEIAD